MEYKEMGLIEKNKILEKKVRDLEIKYKQLFDRLQRNDLEHKYLFKVLEENSLLDKKTEDIKWLIDNRLERMDASDKKIFEPTRADFHLDRYEFAKKYVADKIVGDIACGTGYGTEILAHNKAEKVIGVDISLDAINYAKRYHKLENNDFICSSAHATPLKDNELDILVSFETLEHLENEDELLSEFQRILKKDGILIISTPNDWGVNELSPHHVRSYDYFVLLETLNKYFIVEQLYNQNSGTPNRKENNGQPRGIVQTTQNNHKLAECFIAVCKNGRK